MAWNPFKKNNNSPQNPRNVGKGAPHSDLGFATPQPRSTQFSFSNISAGRKQLNTAPIRLAKRIGDLFYATGKVSEHDIDEAYRLSIQDGILIGRALISMGKLREGEVLNCLEQQKLVTSVDIGRLSIPPEVISMIPESLAHAFSVVPFDVIGDYICVCAKSVLSFETMKAVKDRTRMNVRMFDSLEGWQALKDCIDVYYPVSG
ncbi:MAG: hypothetical protein Kow00107_08850 [Planctomycetota bacterium]